MGLMGLVAGASTAGMLGVVRMMGDTWLPRLAASSEQNHHMIANLHSQRHDSVRRWRAGLENARNAHRRWGFPAMATRPTSSATSGSRVSGRTYRPLARTRNTERLMKSTATTRRSRRCRWRSAESSGSG